MRMIRVRVDDFDFDYLTAMAGKQGNSLAGLVRDMLHAAVIEGRTAFGVSEPSDTAVSVPMAERKHETLAGGKVGRPTTEQWERLNKWLAATGRQPEPGEVTTKSGLLAWAVAQGFQP